MSMRLAAQMASEGPGVPPKSPSVLIVSFISSGPLTVRDVAGTMRMLQTWTFQPSSTTMLTWRTLMSMRWQLRQRQKDWKALLTQHPRAKRRSPSGRSVEPVRLRFFHLCYHDTDEHLCRGKRCNCNQLLSSDRFCQHNAAAPLS